MLYFIIWGALLALAAVAAYFLARIIRKKEILKYINFSLFLIRIPKSINTDGGSEKNFISEINLTEQLINNIASFNKQFAFEVAVPHIGEEIHFFIAVPRKIKNSVIKQIQALWSDASVEYKKDDYTIFNPNGYVSAAYIEQKYNFALPIRTYREIEADTFEGILGAFSRVNEVGEGGAIQIIIKPSPQSAKKPIQKFISLLKKGESPNDILYKRPIINIEALKEAVGAGEGKKENTSQNAVAVDEDIIKSLEFKISKPLFDVNVRLISSANSKIQSDDILDGMISGFNQFGSPKKNAIKAVKLKNAGKLLNQFIFRKFDSGKSMILNSEEIASFFHLPISKTSVPRIKWLKSKEAPAPPNMPSKGLRIGVNVFRGEKTPVYMLDKDRMRHIYIVGQTGTGKSTLLGNMVISDIRNGKGVAIIDPHGDLIENILGHIPKERLNDVIYFDPGDIWKPLGLNMLDYNFDRPEEKTFIVNEMQGIFNKLFSQETMGPMFEQYMRNALLLLMEDMRNDPATLVDVPRVFTDANYRHKKLERINNAVVRNFWEMEAEKAGGEASLANMTPYITSKFNNFIANDYIRPIIGQTKSSFNFRDVMDNGNILLINLSKGKIGDINAGLLGMIFTGKILMSALSRADVDIKSRREFYLYIDEFQNFTTDSISSILSEARKYGLSLTVAHQFIAQLTEKIRDSVFGNVGSQIVFRVGAQDAEFLSKQFEPVFGKNDLINIDNLNAYAKILINGETSSPFSIKIDTFSWEPGDKNLAERVKEFSRAKYGKDRQAVEEEIYSRFRE